MSIINTVVSDFKKDAEAVKSFILKAAADAPAVVATVAKDEASISKVVEAFLPQSTGVINLANTLLDLVANAVESAGEAASVNGLSVSLDQATVKSVQAVITAAKTSAATKA